MKKKTFIRSLVAALAMGMLWIGCSTDSTGPMGPSFAPDSMSKPVGGPPGLEHAKGIQKKYTPDLLAIAEVVGTATGLDPEGIPVVMVFTKATGAAKIPKMLDDVSVIVNITGEVRAYPKKPSPPDDGSDGGGGKGGGKKPDPTPDDPPSEDPQPTDPRSRFPRPVPIGISTGHPMITAGTIACRVTDGKNVYALSNNHVYADENKAGIGDNVLQPGVSDGGQDPADAIGTLYDVEPIRFDGSNNTIDAALALCSSGTLGKATPADGYGMPKRGTVAARVGQAVMKYGRSTGLTKGKVYAINACVKVNYDSGQAVFVDQIVISSGAFSSPGDSGSLVVLSKGKAARAPVGLLFAGNADYTFANPIGEVLNRFGVSIDGQ